MRRALLALACLAASFAAGAFDHSHAAWNALLGAHVRYGNGGTASRVSYAGFQRERPKLAAVLAAFSSVTRAEFDGWSKPRQQAFLINAYNAFTIEKVLARYPNLRSIRDFGTFFGNPWKDRFFTLLGERMHLDQVEHEILRKEGVYDEPRVHVAVVCASVGCPMLRDEAFVAARLEDQLEDSMRRFLSDRSRNRYDAKSGRLQVSRIFDWYGGDFERGHRGYTSVKATLARYASLLADTPEGRARVASQQADVEFLEYDWSLNDAK